jgi:biliverdin reductase
MIFSYELHEMDTSVMVKVGLIGTGYAAKLRAETLQSDRRAELVAIAGRTPDRTLEFSQRYAAIACESWQALLDIPEIDLIVISTINQEHGAIAQAALMADKHVVVEYPLCLDGTEADSLLHLAKTQNKLLHIEHIELLGGVHQALTAALPKIGPVFYARYATLKPERPAPQRWSYHGQQFGFPLVGALSRLHRLVDILGPVATVTCQAQFWETRDGHNQTMQNLPQGYYNTCLCTAHLQFRSGVLAEVTYGKGAALWQTVRTFEVQGEAGALVFEGENGTWITPEGNQPLTVGGRRGLFAKDTAMVLDHLLEGTPLYLTPEASIYTLKVADAARQSAATGGIPIAL